MPYFHSIFHQQQENKKGKRNTLSVHTIKFIRIFKDIQPKYRCQAKVNHFTTNPLHVKQPTVPSNHYTLQCIYRVMTKAAAGRSYMNNNPLCYLIIGNKFMKIIVVV